MLPTSISRFVIRLAVILMFVVCASCKAETPYYVKNFLNDLSTLSGIGNDEDMNGNLQSLREWEIIDEEDLNHLNDKLDYLFLTQTISRFTGIDNRISALSSKGWISQKALPRQKVSYETGQSVIRKAIEFRNNPGTEFYYKAEYTENVKPEEYANSPGDIYFSKEKGSYQIINKWNDDILVSEDASFDQVYEEMDIAETYEVDFSNAEVIPYEPDEEHEVYANKNYELLSAKSHSFKKSGFAISYSLSSSGVSLHISKNENKINFYTDIDIYGVKPNFKWKAVKGDLKNCFFDVKFSATEKIGASVARYKDRYLQFKELDSSSFMNLLKSVVEPEKDHVEASFPICQIKTPIPNIPTAFLNLDLVISIYVSGKVEAVLYNAHEMGFETSDGKMRTISNHTNKIDGEIGGSAKAALGINFSLEAAGFNLADIEVDGGLRSRVKSTLHLYDERGNRKPVSSDIDYSTLQDFSVNNNDVKVCGDLSLNWLFDLELNTYKTQLYSLGFNRQFSILDENDQVFGNMHHIENGMFVKKCTRKDKPVLKENAIPVASNKIVLNSYAEVLSKNNTFTIKIESMPSGYNQSDLYITSTNDSVATISNLTVKGISPGSCQIKICTKDNKYASYVNILVSTE